MFCCVLDANFGMGPSLTEAFEDMLNQRGDELQETREELNAILPGECFFFQEVDVVAYPGGWDIQIK